MLNYFDQFDEQQKPASGNYFDQFDAADATPSKPVGNDVGPQSMAPMRTWGGGTIADQIDPDGRQSRVRDVAKTDRNRAFLRAMSLMNPAGMIASGLLPDKTIDDFSARMFPEKVREVGGGFSLGVGQGGTFGFGDELAGLAGSVIGKGDEFKARARNSMQLSYEDAPVSTFAGEMTGGIISPVNKVLAPAKVLKSPTLAKAALEGAQVGAKGGAIYGAGAAEGGLSERARGAGQGALYGGAAGAVFGAGGQKLMEAWNARSAPANVILETARQQLNIPKSSIAGLRQVLSSGGYSGDDIDRGIVSIADRLQSASETGDRAGLFALELQKEFPSASQNIQDVFQQLMTAPPRQGQTGRILTQALDDQYGSQGSFVEGITQQKLGSNTVQMEQKVLGTQRKQIGAARDKALNDAKTDGRARGLRNQMGKWYEDYSVGDAADREVMGTMRAAARQLGFSGKNEASEAMAADPIGLMNKFQELAFKNKAATPVLEQARTEAQGLLDDATRFGREDGNFAFAKKNADEVGPYKQKQQEFRANYSQEEAIADARGKFGQVRDPVKADEFIGWYDGLPQSEQSLVKTVIRQDIEKMLRGGNIDQDGAYLTNLKKVGVNDVLERMFGEDGKSITKAISQVVEEQKGLTGLDPRKGLQERVVRGPSADRARNLYTTNPIARIGDRLPAMSQMADIGLMASGQLPYITMAKQGSKLFRPRAGTREGLARLFAMRPEDAASAAAAKAPITPTVMPSASSAGGLPKLTAPEAPNSSPLVISAEQRSIAARQKVELARQRAQQAKAAAANEGEVRQLEVEAAQAEAEARIAEQSLATAQKVTAAARAAVAKATGQQVKAARKAEPKMLKQAIERETRQVNDTAARVQSQAAERELASARQAYDRTMAEAAQIERAGQNRAQAERLRAEAEAAMTTAREKASWVQAEEMARAGVDPAAIQQQTGRVYIRTEGGRSVQLTPDAPKMSPAQAQKEFDRFWNEVDPDQWPKWVKTQLFDIQGVRDAQGRARMLAIWKERFNSRQVEARANQIKADRAKKTAREAAKQARRRRAAQVAVAGGATAAGAYAATKMEPEPGRYRRTAPTTITVRKAKQIANEGKPTPPSRKPKR